MPQSFSGYYSAIQSYDGYQILVTFHKMRYYYQFYEKLRMKYVDISWRYDEINQVTEGKIAYSEDDWVNLIISDDYEGSPIMIVMRERTAVAWMEKEFYELTSSIPGQFEGCLFVRSFVRLLLVCLFVCLFVVSMYVCCFVSSLVS